MAVIVRISDRSAKSFFLCLAIGVLQAVRDKATPSDLGVRTIGRPHISHFLEEHSIIDESSISVYQESDELSGLEILRPDLLDENLSRLIATLEDALSKSDYRDWVLTLDSDDSSARGL